MKMPDELKEKDVSGKPGPTEIIKKNWFLRKYTYLTGTVKSLLTQGISPEKIALAMAIGFITGTFPILGTHTPIGIALAFVFRVNQVAVYLGTWLAAPFYILILLPSLRVGEYLLKADRMNMDSFLAGLKRMAHSFKDFTDVWTQYGYSIFHLVIGWIPFAIVIGLVVYFLVLYFARMITKKKN